MGTIFDNTQYDGKCLTVHKSQTDETFRIPANIQMYRFQVNGKTVSKIYRMVKTRERFSLWHFLSQFAPNQARKTGGQPGNGSQLRNFQKHMYLLGPATSYIILPPYRKYHLVAALLPIMTCLSCCGSICKTV